jgi:glycosyltransferase involved in cell wall biosynthesis
MVQGCGTVIRTGFVAYFDDGWLGGVSYFRNLLVALYALPDRQLEAVIFTGTRAEEKHFIGFPDVKIVRSQLFDRGTLPWMIRKAWLLIFSRDLLLERLLKRYNISVLSHSGWLGKKASIPTIGWIPDFQHLHLPDCFDSKELDLRNRAYLQTCRYCSAVIVSSYSAQVDLGNFDAQAHARSHVLQFVSVSDHEASRPVSGKDLEEEYRYTGRYFLLPNQLWKHKNHMVVIEALGLLRNEGKNVLVFATGHAVDYRHPEHFKTLMLRIEELGLKESFRYLGLVPSANLAALMRDAIAILNPSLFEGWSTTVEEAKALGKRVIVSDIPVHREQAPMYATYFVPNDAKALAEILWTAWGEPAPDVEARRTQARRAAGTRRIEFAQRYQDIVLGLVRSQS